MWCVYSKPFVQQYSPSSSTSSLKMIKPFIYLNKEKTKQENIKNLFTEENNKMRKKYIY